MIRILEEPNNSIIKQYKEILKVDNVDLKFTKEAIDKVADDALKKKIGARGLRSILEPVMNDIIYNLNDEKEIIVNENMIN